jgi:hypothetical protein
MAVAQDTACLYVDWRFPEKAQPASPTDNRKQGKPVISP